MSDKSSHPDTTTAPGPEGSPWGFRNVIAYLGGAFLGLVLLVATWAKAMDPSAFADQVTREGLDFLLPAMAVAMFALALEIFLGAALILGVRRLWVLGTSAALVVFFLFLTGRNYWRDLQGIAPDDGASCGCFGNLVERTPAEAFWQDALLMVPALLLAFLVIDRQPAWPRIRLGIAGVLTVLTMVFTWKAPDLPLDDWATRLRPGSDPATMCAGSEEDATRVCLDGILPEITEGEHFVILADIEEPGFADQVPILNEYHWAGNGAQLWVVSANTEEELFAFRFGSGPAFEIREVPPALIKPLYRTLPRSFLMRDGTVEETWSGLPPLGMGEVADTN